MALHRPKASPKTKSAKAKKSSQSAASAKSQKRKPAIRSPKVAASALLNLTLVSYPDFKPSKTLLQKWVNRVALELQARSADDSRLKNLSWSNAELTIAFLDIEQARVINRTYRGRDYATDVLSFSDDSPGVLGELAICPEVVLKQAKEHGMSFDEELGYMILHGMLHLLGFDHEKSKREEKAMFSLQDSIFDRLR